jgi:serine/threonine protein kinase/Tfp pilus assembly protein PilF
MPVDPQRVQSAFLAAVEAPDPDARAAILDRECQGDGELRRRVEALLKAHDQPGSSLDQPAGDPGVTGEVAPGRWLDPQALPPLSEGPGSRVGPYKLLQLLGEGGMGAVFLAEQEQPVKRRVALKVVKAGMDSARVLARFEAERQALALMDHPHIAKVLDAGTTQSGRPYFVMELVKGIPLTRFCDQEHLTPKERLELFVPVCQAVQHAHTKGIIHRDLKPSNVLIALYDGRPVPKVIDFGVAKATGQRLTERTLFTEVGQVVGTLEYMAPEQAELNNLDIDTRADVYSLGVLLYELLAGSPPFTAKQLRGAAFSEVLRLIREVEPQRPSTRLSSSEDLPAIAAKRKLEPAKLARLVRGDLDWIVMRALEKDRARRYQTANGLAMDLQRYLADEPVLAGPPTLRYRLRKFVRKHRGPVLAAGIILALLVAAVAALAAGLVVVNRERQAAEAARQRTRAALDEMSSQVIEDWLAQKAQLEPAQRAFLEKALAYYEDFARESGHSREVRQGVAGAHLRVGNIRARLGQHAEAEAAYVRARELYAHLAAEFPAVPQYRRDLAGTHDNLGRLLQDTGRMKEAAAAHREALEIRKALAAEFPDVPQHRQDLAMTHNNLGALLYNTGRPPEAEAALREALAIQKALAADYPGVPRYRQDVALTHNNLGWLLYNTGRPKEAEAAYADALDIRKRLAADFPNVPDYRHHLAGTYKNLGVLLRTTGRPKEAEEAYREALDIHKRLTADFPKVPEYHQMLAMNHVSLGITLRETGRPLEAEAAYREALVVSKRLAAEFTNVPDYQDDVANTLDEMAELARRRKDYPEARRLLEEAEPYLKRALEANPRHPFYREVYSDTRRVLAATLLELGEYAGAAEAAADLARLAFEPAGDAYKAAGFFARCIPLAEKDAKLPEAKRKELAQSYADQALEALRQAVAKGYKDAALMKKDTDLDPLRGRDDFQKLLAEVEAAAKPEQKKGP